MTHLWQPGEELRTVLGGATVTIQACVHTHQRTLGFPDVDMVQSRSVPSLSKRHIFIVCSIFDTVSDK